MSNNTESNSAANSGTDDEMLGEYDFSQARRGNPYRHLNRSSVRVQTRIGDREVQIKTVELLATVAPDGKVVLQLPPDITPGDHRITLLIEDEN